MNLQSGVRPVMIVFDTKSRSRQKRRPRLRKPITKSPPPRFAFIHVSPPEIQDESCRRLIKTHVMQNVQRQAEKLSAEGKADAAIEVSMLGNESLRESRVYREASRLEDSPKAPPSNLNAFPIEMQPYMLKLLQKYAILMCSTWADVTKSTWLPLIMTDPALLHAILCTSAASSKANSDTQSTNAVIQRKHMLESVRLINARLSGVGATSDTTIITVLFMAKSECFHGNYNTWHVHMNGVRKMVELRGGIGMLPRLIQQKIYNVDLAGCIENGTMPYFPIFPIYEPLPSLRMTNIPPNVDALAKRYEIHQGLLNLLGKISVYTASPNVAFKETPNLPFQMLSFYYRIWPIVSDNSIFRERFHHHLLQTQRQVIEGSLLLGALLYLSLPHLPVVLPPTRPVNYEHLLHHLTNYVDLLFDHYARPEHSILLLWLLFLGEIFSSSPQASASRYRTKLRTIMAEMCISNWGDMSSILSALWWVEAMSDDPYRQIWEMISTYP